MLAFHNKQSDAKLRGKDELKNMYVYISKYGVPNTLPYAAPDGEMPSRCCKILYNINHIIVGWSRKDVRMPNFPKFPRNLPTKFDM